MDEIAIQIKGLMESILKIPGKKILTLATEHLEPFVIDVSEDGVLGYEEGHDLLFKAKLFSAFRSVGGLTVRQFLSIKVEEEMPNGKKLWIPRKNIYGVRIAYGDWTPLSKLEIRSAYCTDYSTGKPITPGKDVSFCNFPI